MFSANENLVLRQHKRRIVDQIESTMPEEALDMGTSVMVMQVSCKAPGCVPLETAIIIVFPASTEELVPGLPESNGGSYKTKILKPMADVSTDDVLEALPPAFIGGRRTTEKLCLYARDVMLAQITQVFGDDDKDNDIAVRREMAEYLQHQLQLYIQNRCQAPEIGEPFAESTSTMNRASNIGDGQNNNNNDDDGNNNNNNLNEAKDSVATKNNDSNATSSSSSSLQRQQLQRRVVQSTISQSLGNNHGSNIQALFQREHAPGMRKPGCPCCDSDTLSALMDNMTML